MNANGFVTEIPVAPEEISLSQAIGLIPKISPFTTDESYLCRLRISDPIIRVYSLDILIGRGVNLNDHDLSVAMHTARYSSYVRQILSPILIKAFRFDLVERLIKMESESIKNSADAAVNLLTAEYENDFKEQVSFHEQLYLQTGSLRHINMAAKISRERLSWRDALKHNVRMIFVQEEKTLEVALINFMQLLEREGAQKEFMALAPIINSLDNHKICRSYIIAMILFWKKDYRECLEFLHNSKALEITKHASPLLSNLAARCYEAIGDYKKSAIWYDCQNDSLKDPKFNPEKFIEGIKSRSEIPYVKVPNSRENYFVMTGFPRSGTTLLENALSSHPEIVTCEETSSLIGSFHTAFTAPMSEDPDKKKASLRLGYHQKLYYQNIDRFIGGSSPKVVIDKTPIISANIKYLEKVLPGKKYIFSIRHPYDVVLSNLKQTYAQNGAMSSFNNIHDACALYSQTMSDWFDVFPGSVDRVCYIKYDDLVENFRREMEKALTFLGVDWTDEVMNFVKHSQKRAVRTPSYANVRRGLGLGVQTSWRNFDFLFDQKARSLLDPWVKHFGYQV